MIYFDNAATSFPKPERVIERVDFALRELGGNPGRSAHRLSMIADREVFACRVKAAELFGADLSRVIFVPNTTYALNMAIRTAYRGGGILISDLEHNSVRRPSLAVTKDVRIFDSHIELSGEERTRAIISSVKSKLRGASLVVCAAASNICGASMPIRELGKLCRESGVTFIVDGAQAAGIRNLSVRGDNIGILCLPGHKGLYGPGGSGMMILSDEITPRPFIFGGSGVDSLDAGMPSEPPERYEGGTLPVAVISGLLAGLEFVSERGTDSIRAHEVSLSERLIGRLSDIGRVKLFLPECVDEPTMVLFRIKGSDPEETAAILDERGICVRAGYHCAPLAHQRLGTGQGGAVRVSFSAFNTAEEVDALYEVIKELAGR